MDDLEEKLGSILNDPNMMRQIMSMAQAMGGTSGAPAQENVPPQTPPEFDAQTLARISALAQSGNIDKRERALLQALGAYLSKERVGKLEKAMRAAKIAKLASAPAGRAGAFPTGR